MKVHPIIEFLLSDSADTYFGRGFVIKAEILAHHLTGKGTLTEIARKHNLTKQSMTRYARHARAVFGECKQEVD